jgi:tetratricopeptide (TPR) repeat protein
MRIRSIFLAFSLAAAGCAGQSSPPPAAPAPTPAAASVAAPAAPPLTAVQRSALKRDGMAAYDRKDFATCGRLLEQAADHYNAACCYAQAGDRDRAFALLDRAITIDDFTDQGHLAADSDLASLHADPRWEATAKTIAARVTERRAHLNPELLQIYEDDQADRRKPYEQIDWKQVTPRDQARRKRVDEIVAAGGAKIADDYYHAAMVYQHGETPDEIQRAYDLAKKAVELDPRHKRARWLAAAAEDRKLMYEKKPQKWGTQYTKKDGKWVLWEIDPAVTDEQREEWNVPPLAEARAQAERMNRGGR